MAPIAIAKSGGGDAALAVIKDVKALCSWLHDAHARRQMLVGASAVHVACVAASAASKATSEVLATEHSAAAASGGAA